ncbi:MAG: hypothetical protein NTV45_08565 [Firmicutes bacterium]|nr:hypothetical protein [Bacillota bacterium]
MLPLVFMKDARLPRFGLLAGEYNVGGVGRNHGGLFGGIYNMIFPGLQGLQGIICGKVHLSIS